MNVVTRFAPSPTGDLHLGGARVALYNWLYAKKMQGKFILRIEDSDVDRSRDESVTSIISGMQWLGLDYDEGPFYQSQRLSRYQMIIAQLLTSGHAYKCYCTPERLEQLRAQQMASKLKPRYDGLCRNKTDSEGKSYVVRFKNPLEGEVSFTDAVRGKLTFNNSELDDLIIARSNGMPTYNFSVVVDDYDMKITHVIRGDDHINNTPRQINILLALNAHIPTYVHLPLILDENGKKLSKREGAANVLSYRDAGIVPIALLNYLIRLGWSHGDQEVFSLPDMIACFSLTKISRAPAALNPKKLQWLNQLHMNTFALEDLIPLFKWQCRKISLDLHHGPDPSAVVELQRARVKNLHDMAIDSAFFYQTPKYSDEIKFNFVADDVVILQALAVKFAALDLWTAANIMDTINLVSSTHALTLAKVSQLLRLVITGRKSSPALDKIITLLDKKVVVDRLQNAINLINSRS